MSGSGLSRRSVRDADAFHQRVKAGVAVESTKRWGDFEDIQDGRALLEGFLQPLKSQCVIAQMPITRCDQKCRLPTRRPILFYVFESPASFLRFTEDRVNCSQQQATDTSAHLHRLVPLTAKCIRNSKEIMGDWIGRIDLQRFSLLLDGLVELPRVGVRYTQGICGQPVESFAARGVQTQSPD